jgi:hypothetical protein
LATVWIANANMLPSLSLTGTAATQASPTNGVLAFADVTRGQSGPFVASQSNMRRYLQRASVLDQAVASYQQTLQKRRAEERSCIRQCHICKCHWVIYSTVCNNAFKDTMPNIEKGCDHLVQTECAHTSGLRIARVGMNAGQN